MSSLSPELKKSIEKLLSTHPVVLFMKGNADSPMCGFSARAATMLQQLNVPFHDVNILEDDDLRTGLKIYGDWPTFPQLYVNGELIGGSDIMLEMHHSGELEQLLKPFRS